MVSPQFVYEPTTHQAARAIVSAKAYLVRLGVPEEQFFTWKSGIRAPVYMNAREIARSPASAAIIGRALGSAIRARFAEAQYVIGVAEAGIIWSTLSAYELGLPQAFIQKQEKEHGMRGRIACNPPHGVNAVVVDDLIASGESIEEAIDVLWRERQIRTIGVQSIINWNLPEMRTRFDELDVPVSALVSYPQLLLAAFESGLIGETAVAELTQFYESPRTHRWNAMRLRAVR
jgi:orotate phosphoribosyltransferase